MFNCQICGTTTKPNEVQTKVVVKKRTKAKGWEIEEEINVCQKCLDDLKKRKEK